MQPRRRAAKYMRAWHTSVKMEGQEIKNIYSRCSQVDAETWSFFFGLQFIARIIVFIQEHYLDLGLLWSLLPNATL